MTISTESYTAATGQARQATEKSVEVYKNAAQIFANQFDAVKLPTVDLTQPVTRYFEYLRVCLKISCACRDSGSFLWYGHGGGS